MEYTIKKLAQLAGVTPRALRYYDEIDLLKPSRVNHSGYRIYGRSEVDRLQQILFYRKLDLALEEIKKILDDENYDVKTALKKQYQTLLEQKNQLEKMMALTQQTLAYYEGEIKMTDQEKFAAFKEAKIAENKAQYGSELQEKYGTAAIEESHEQLLGLTQAEYQEMQTTEAELLTELTNLRTTGAVESDAGKKIYQLHKKWLQFSWTSYSPEAHRGVAEMYVNDPRFTEYYDKKSGPGAASLLKDTIDYWS